MRYEVLNVVKPFMGFVSSYQPMNAHNMFVFMVDPLDLKIYITYYRFCGFWYNHAYYHSLWLWTFDAFFYDYL
jgi:hypothetical protein